MKKNIALIAAALSVLVTGCANKTKFESFAQIEAGKTYKTPAMTSTIDTTYDAGVPKSFSGEATTDLNALVTAEYEDAQMLKSATIKDKDSEVVFSDILEWEGENGSGYVVTIANPKDFSFDYQTLGMWNSTFTGDRIENVTSSVFSTGVITSFSDIPKSGTHVFYGIYGGEAGENATFYNVIGLASLNADFSRKVVAFSLNGAELYNSNMEYVRSSDQFDLAGSLYYYNENEFSGSVFGSFNDLEGTATGRFYGPTANELGGIVFAKEMSADDKYRIRTLNVAFGAKR